MTVTFGYFFRLGVDYPQYGSEFFLFLMKMLHLSELHFSHQKSTISYHFGQLSKLRILTNELRQFSNRSDIYSPIEDHFTCYLYTSEFPIHFHPIGGPVSYFTLT